MAERDIITMSQKEMKRLQVIQTKKGSGLDLSVIT